MKMQDKEFDQLFNAKFADFEVEPTEGLWNKIATEIPGNKEIATAKKRSLSPFIQIAAGLIVVLAAGLLFMPSTPKVALHGNYDAANQPKEVSHPQVAADTYGDLVSDPVQTSPQQTAEGVSQPVKIIAVKNIEKVTAPVDTIQNTIAEVKPEIVAKPEYREPLLKTPIVSNAVAYIIPKEDLASKPVKAIAVADVPQQKTTTEVVKKKKIRSLGDLLNVVIAKVDKRDNKAIVFGNSGDEDDDGLLSVTGVNIGPIKVKKQN
jgi:hypothetical protein